MAKTFGVGGVFSPDVLRYNGGIETIDRRVDIMANKKGEGVVEPEPVTGEGAKSVTVVVYPQVGDADLADKVAAKSRELRRSITGVTAKVNRILKAAEKRIEEVEGSVKEDKRKFGQALALDGRLVSGVAIKQGEVDIVFMSPEDFTAKYVSGDLSGDDGDDDDEGGEESGDESPDPA